MIWFDSCCSTNLAFTAEAVRAKTDRLENFMLSFGGVVVWASLWDRMYE